MTAVVGRLMNVYILELKRYWCLTVFISEYLKNKKIICKVCKLCLIRLLIITKLGWPTCVFLSSTRFTSKIFLFYLFLMIWSLSMLLSLWYWTVFLHIFPRFIFSLFTGFCCFLSVFFEVFLLLYFVDTVSSKISLVNLFFSSTFPRTSNPSCNMPLWYVYLWC